MVKVTCHEQAGDPPGQVGLLAGGHLVVVGRAALPRCGRRMVHWAWSGHRVATTAR
jgi:hypothetical protein